MLELTIPEGSELYDEKLGMFLTSRPQKLRLEHSLLSISKWESIWKRPFISKREMTFEESVSYVQCMSLDHIHDPSNLMFLSQEDLVKISDYVKDPMSATIIYKPEKEDNGFKETVTSELIYTWMTLLTIPWSAEKWHLNRLLNLIEICQLKSQPPKKTTPAQRAEKLRAMNAERLKRYGTKG